MRNVFIEQTLAKLQDLIAQDRFENLETDTLEIKPVPSAGAEWREIHKSACAFLNTRSGILILGIKEEGQGAAKRYVFTGWQPYAEPNIKELPNLFTERNGTPLDLRDCFPPPTLKAFMGGTVMVQLVDELSADRKYVFYRGEAYRRHLTGDHRITEVEISRQEEYREEALQARELIPVQGLTVSDLDLDKLNSFIFQLNQPTQIETMKSDLEQALSFLERRCFLKEGKVTTLGALVCGKHPADVLGFRAQVHGYVDMPQEIARDKQDFTDNVLELMKSSLGYLLRNIQVGISAEQGGVSRPQYPEELLREMVNNALAHRDYSINRQVIVAVKPGAHVSIQNPGSFRRHLLLERPDDPIPLRRILPEAKPRNPKLADALRVFRKWEGRGIGMATLVNFCLVNQIDLPYYRLGTEEVTLYLRNGRLLDERMERLFKGHDRYIEEKMQGNALSEPQKLVLSYLIKSEWENERVGYTVLLTSDNNHFNELLALERADLISKHSASTSTHPIYVADRILMRKDYLPELRKMFGVSFDNMDRLAKDVLGVVYRFNHFSKAQAVSAKETSFDLWAGQGGIENIKQFDALYRQVRRKLKPQTVSAKETSFELWAARGGADDIKQFDAFYRKVRRMFNVLEKAGFIRRMESRRRSYVLQPKVGSDMFLSGDS
jgi:ATP-dependent DNA helicase RecG